MPTCLGSSKSPGALCICTSFVPKSPPKENKCDICGHRRSAHTDDAPNTNGKYFNRLLKNIAATAVHEEARKETIQGFRPRQHSSTVAASTTTTSTMRTLLSLHRPFTLLIHSFVVLIPKGEGKDYPSHIYPHYLWPILW